MVLKLYALSCPMTFGWFSSQGVNISSLYQWNLSLMFQHWLWHLSHCLLLGSFWFERQWGQVHTLNMNQISIALQIKSNLKIGSDIGCPTMCKLLYTCSRHRMSLSGLFLYSSCHVIIVQLLSYFSFIMTDTMRQYCIINYKLW